MIKQLFNRKAVPRWVILIIDLVISSSSFVFSYFLLKQFDFSTVLRGHFFIYTGLYGLVSLTVFYLMRIHTGLIRYSNIHDMFRIFSAVLITCVLYSLLAKFVVIKYYHIHSLDVFKTLFVNFFITSSLLVMLRTMVKGFFYYIRRISTANLEKAVILGTDNTAIVIKQALQSSSRHQFVIIGFVDTEWSKVNSVIQQHRVFHYSDLAKLKRFRKLDMLIMTNDELAGKEKKKVIDMCLKLSIKVLTVPPADQWVYGQLNLREMQQLKIEDLLQREPIVINNSRITSELAGKRILITGAAGSIGSEIVRQVLQYKPGLLILCDQAESFLHEIQLEMEEKYPDANIQTFITSIQNQARMLLLFKEWRPQVVFHAAAYKHVPMMEKHPSEAIMNNVMGTKNVVDLAVFYEAEKFIMVSTDKAVNPTNVMGASKRIAEMYVQSINEVQDLQLLDGTAGIRPAGGSVQTKFITTRFGNVLDSNGSVIPRFRAQIQKGGPVTVTHPEITRFFMTIPEAVQLVLEAGTMGKGGDILVFDMGQAVKISDLALKMIKLAGQRPDKDIKIVFTGLRPGEKLYEEVLNEKEKTIPTHHEKIWIANIIPHSFNKILKDVEELVAMCEQEDNEKLVRKMKEIVPEYVSNNSQYEKLDEIRNDNRTVPASANGS